MTDPDYGRTGYIQRGGLPARPQELIDRFPGDKSESMTGVGMLARVFTGEDPRKSDAIQKGAALSARLPPTWNPSDGSIDMYYWYYATLAMFQVGGKAWIAWNDGAGGRGRWGTSARTASPARTRLLGPGRPLGPGRRPGVLDRPPRHVPGGAITDTIGSSGRGDRGPGTGRAAPGGPPLRRNRAPRRNAGGPRGAPLRRNRAPRRNAGGPRGAAPTPESGATRQRGRPQGGRPYAGIGRHVATRAAPGGPPLRRDRAPRGNAGGPRGAAPTPESGTTSQRRGNSRRDS